MITEPYQLNKEHDNYHVLSNGIKIHSDYKAPKGPLEPDFTPDDLKVGQVWECIEDKKCIVLISLVMPKYIKGYLFNGFEVVEYHSMDLQAFTKYWRLTRDRKNG